MNLIYLRFLLVSKLKSIQAEHNARKKSLPPLNPLRRHSKAIGYRCRRADSDCEYDFVARKQKRQVENVEKRETIASIICENMKSIQRALKAGIPKSLLYSDNDSE